jgi:hypothetical protein
MKYLRRFNESSQSAKDYKFRRDVLPDEIEDILLPLRDELILYKITFPTSDLKKIEIDIQHQYDKLINREVIKGTFSHLLSYLRSEGFEVSYYWTESESSDITTPEKFSFEDFFRLIPDYFNQMYLAFLYSSNKV